MTTRREDHRALVLFLVFFLWFVVLNSLGMPLAKVALDWWLGEVPPYRVVCGDVEGTLVKQPDGTWRAECP